MYKRTFLSREKKREHQDGKRLLNTSRYNTKGDFKLKPLLIYESKTPKPPLKKISKSTLLLLYNFRV